MKNTEITPHFHSAHSVLFRLSTYPEIKKEVEKAKRNFTPELANSLDFLPNKVRENVGCDFLEQARKTSYSTPQEYFDNFTFDFMNALIGRHKPTTNMRKLHWEVCKGITWKSPVSYQKSLRLSTTVADAFLQIIPQVTSLEVAPVKIEELPDYKVLKNDEIVCFIEFKYRAVPFFFIHTLPYKLRCFNTITLDIAKIESQIGQIARARTRGKTVHPTFYVFFVDYPCLRLVLFQDLEVLNRILNLRGIRRKRKEVWGKRVSKKEMARVSTYFSILTDLRDFSELLNAFKRVRKGPPIESEMKDKRSQDFQRIEELYAKA